MNYLTNKQIKLIKQALDALECAAGCYPQTKEAERDWRELINIIDALKDYIYDRV